MEPIDLINLLKDWKYDPGLHFSKRNTEKFELGEKAFISWSSKSLTEVEIMEVIQDHVTVKVLKNIETKATEIGSILGLRLDEVRHNPIDALINRVTC